MLEFALRILRDECKKHNNCENCPLHRESDSNACAVAYRRPYDYELKSDAPDDKEPLADSLFTD